MKTVVKTRSAFRHLAYSAICLGLCMVLPFLTGQLPQIGNMLCPMHIPVLLCGYLCGPWWAMAVGLLAPSLRFLLFSMPPILPKGLAMTFELAAYGLTAGVLYREMPRKIRSLFLSLIGAMVVGRMVWGLASFIIFNAMELSFTWHYFLAEAVINAIPGIVVHILLIPTLVIALKSSKIIDP